jgi:hypothetical protein
MVSRPAVGRGFGVGHVGPASPKARRVLVQSNGGHGGALRIYNGKGPQGVGRRETHLVSRSAGDPRLKHSYPRNERRNMLRRNLVGILVLVLVGTVAVGAQVKESQRTPIKPINQPSVVDINAAAEADIVSIGIERTAAKKIVEGRPWRSKRDLVTKQVLTKEQYEKFKNSLIAKQSKKS